MGQQVGIRLADKRDETKSFGLIGLRHHRGLSKWLPVMEPAARL
jgi:hypothetical protein